MKKITRLTLVGPLPAGAQPSGENTRSSGTVTTPRAPRRTVPLKKMFSVRDDIDTLTLLTHANDLLESLALISANFVNECAESQRHVAVAIKQLSGLAEIVVCRARDQVAQQQSPASSGPEIRH